MTKLPINTAMIGASECMCKLMAQLFGVLFSMNAPWYVLRARTSKDKMFLARSRTGTMVTLANGSEAVGINDIVVHQSSGFLPSWAKLTKINIREMGFRMFKKTSKRWEL